MKKSKKKYLIPTLLPAVNMPFILFSSCGQHKNDTDIHVEKVTINEGSSGDFDLDQNTFQLTCTVSPSNATNKEVKWSSSNKAVAIVDDAGLVAFNAIGTAYITATTVDGGKTSTYEINIHTEIIHVLRVVINEGEGERVPLTEEETQLTCSVYPSDATNKNVTWSSSDESVATVSNDGEIQLKSCGLTTIKVTTADRGKTDSLNLEVYEKNVPVTDVTIVDKYGHSEGTFPFSDEKINLDANISPEDATYKTLKWESSDTTIAGVDQTGKVNFFDTGEVDIKATAIHDQIFATYRLTIAPAYIPVTSIELDKTEKDITGSDFFNITATVKPKNATNKTVIWESSDTTIATVSDTGGVYTTGKSGTCTIKATTDDQSKTATCTVRVTQEKIHVNKVVINQGGSGILSKGGGDRTLTCTVKPDNATDKTIYWSSDDSNIASIEKETGKITPMSVGSTTITAKSKSDSGITATYQVRVVDDFIPITGITFTAPPSSIEAGQERTIEYEIQPEGATDKTLLWSSSDEDVVKVDQSGKITAIAAGTANITATSFSSAQSATFQITITAKTIHVNHVEIDQGNELDLSIKDNTKQLTCSVYPSDATNKNVTWNSSSSSCLSIDENGLLSPKQVGKSTITVTTVDGSHTDTCDVYVKHEMHIKKVIYPTGSQIPQYVDLPNAMFEGESCEIAILDEDDEPLKNLSSLEIYTSSKTSLEYECVDGLHMLKAKKTQQGMDVVDIYARLLDEQEAEKYIFAHETMDVQDIALSDWEFEFDDSESLLKAYVTNYIGDKTDVRIPDHVQHNGKTYTVTRINDKALVETNIQTLTIPTTIKKIQKAAIVESHQLKNVIYEGTIQEWINIDKDDLWFWNTPIYRVECNDDDILVENMFGGLFQLEFNDRDRHAKIKEFVLSDLWEINDIIIPTYVYKNDELYTISSIGDKVFFDISSLKTLKMHDSITKIGTQAFGACRNLTEITLSNSLIEIPKLAFNATDSLTNINIPTSVTKIGEQAFEHSQGLKSINIPNSVIEIDNNAFMGCSNLESAVVPPKVKVFGHSIFEGCALLKDISFPNSELTYIPDSMFYSCDSLDEITIPEGITKIDTCAFMSCKKLKKVTLPSTITDIEDMVFRDCKALSQIVFNGTKEQWKSIVRWRFWHDNTKIKQIQCTDGNIGCDEK